MCSIVSAGCSARCIVQHGRSQNFVYSQRIGLKRHTIILHKLQLLQGTCLIQLAEQLHRQHCPSSSPAQHVLSLPSLAQRTARWSKIYISLSADARSVQWMNKVNSKCVMLNWILWRKHLERNGEYKWMGHVNFDTYGKEIKREWKKIQPEIFSCPFLSSFWGMKLNNFIFIRFQLNANCNRSMCVEPVRNAYLYY